MTTTTRTPTRVCVVWRESYAPETLRTLVYGNGLIRTYPPDRIDGRAGDVPVLTDELTVRKHLTDPEQIGFTHAVAVPVRLAMRLFNWRPREFA